MQPNEQSRAEGAKNVEPKARPQQPPTPSRSPGDGHDKPQVFVAGDATSAVFSQLTSPDDSEHPSSKTAREAPISGAQFVRDVLDKLCGDALDVRPTGFDPTAHRGASRAILRQFGDRHRIDKYLDCEGDPTPKAQCGDRRPRAHSQPGQPSHGRLYFAATWDQDSHVRIASVLKPLLRTGDEEEPLRAAIIGALRAIRATHHAG